MKMRVKNKQKERLLVFSTIGVMAIIVLIWIFQFRGMIASSWNQETQEIQTEYTQVIADVESFQQDMETYLPDMTGAFEALLEQAYEAESGEDAPDNQSLELLAQDVVEQIEQSQDEVDENISTQEEE